MATTRRGNYKWEPDLTGGINQHTSPFLMRDNEFQLLVNCTQEYMGVLSHRLGSEKFLNTVDATAPVRGLGMYKADDGTNYFHMVCDTDLHVYENSGSTWTVQDSAVWSADSEIDLVSFNNYMYAASSNTTEKLVKFQEDGSTTEDVVALTSTASSSSTGSTLVVDDNIFTEKMVGLTVENTNDSQTRTITAFTNPTTVTVDTAINDTWDNDTIEIYMYGKYAAKSGAFLMVAHHPVFPERAYVTAPETDTFPGSDFFVADSPITGIGAFGNNRPFVVFSEDSALICDPVSFTTIPIDGFGCASNRSIQTLRGTLIWFDKDAFYALSSGSSIPQEISLPIRNKTTGDAIIDQIASTNYAVVASGVVDDRYRAVLRDLSSNVKGENLDDVMVELDVNQESWKVHTYTANGLGSVFAKFTDANDSSGLYAGSYDSGTVYKLDIPSTYTDEDDTPTAQDVTSIIITKWYDVSSKKAPTFMGKIQAIDFRYYATSSITVKIAFDGNSTYNDFTTLDAYTTTEWTEAYARISRQCKQFSLRFETTGDFKLYGFGGQYDNGNSRNIKSV